MRASSGDQEVGEVRRRGRKEGKGGDRKETREERRAWDWEMWGVGVEREKKKISVL